MGGWESRTSKNPPTLNRGSSSSLSPYPLSFNTLLSTFYPLPQLSILPLASTLPSSTLPYPHFQFSPLLSRSEPPPTPSPSFDPFYRLPLPPQSFHSPKPISLTHPPPHASPPLQLRHRHVPSPARTSFAGNPGDVTTRSALLPALSRKDAKVVTCPERQRACAQEGACLTCGAAWRKDSGGESGGDACRRRGGVISRGRRTACCAGLPCASVGGSVASCPDLLGWVNSLATSRCESWEV